MAIITRKVSEFPEAANPRDVNVFGQDGSTGQSVKVNTTGLVGDTGPAPDITVQITAVPYGTAPSVDKSGTETAPVFNIKFPLAADGKTPLFRNSGTYIQYRYDVANEWVNLVDLDVLRLHYSDLTDAQKQELMQPALDAAETAKEATNAANAAAQAANTAAANVKDGEDGKTPVFEQGTATALGPEEPPTVSLVQTGADAGGNPVYTLSAGIPQGQRGIQGFPPKLINGAITTGAPGSSVSFTFTYAGVDADGSPRYRVDGSIPQGVPGAGNGNVEVNPQSLKGDTQYVFIPNEDGSPIGTFVEFVPPDNQVNANWNETDTTSKAYIENKPALKPVATSGEYNDLGGKPNLAPAFVTGNTYNATETGVSQTLQNRSIQNGVGTPAVVQLPVANELAAGVMPASAFEQIQQNTQDITRLKSQTGGVRLGSFATKAALDAFTLPDGAKAGDNAIVRDDETQGDVTTSYALMDTGGGALGWDFDFIVNYDPIGLATTTTPGLKKSSAVDGQTFTETDGTDSVVGWDALKQRVTDVETDIDVLPVIGINKVWSEDNTVVGVTLSGSPKTAVTVASFVVYNAVTGAEVAISSVTGSGTDYELTIPEQTDNYGITFIN
jgi:hypothetical protein